MGGFSLIHWIILGVVILLLFGGNRFSAMMGDVAKGLKSFKHGMSEDDEPKRPADQRPADAQRQIPPQQPIDITPQPQPTQQQQQPRPADSAAPPPPRDDNAS
ncbi:MAG: twin-arginine translocase TatA/TatE family subunit [Pseudomonadota bacterium]|nr:twin-arginine translocase TatA/TatE family subunit [Pseudomonadota bacterium]